jgi:hypothetical protein
MIKPFLSIEITQASNNETVAGFQATTHNTYKYPISMHLLGKDTPHTINLLFPAGAGSRPANVYRYISRDCPHNQSILEMQTGRNSFLG